MSRIESSGLIRRILGALVAAALMLPVHAKLAVAEEQSIRMWTFLNPRGTADRELALASIIKEFETANPGTKIVVEQQVWDQMTPKFLAAHAAGNAPDIIWANSDVLGNVLKAGALADIVSSFTAEDLKDLDNNLVRAAGGQGKQYAVGHSYTIMGLLAWGDHLKKAGIDPAAIATWDDLAGAAKALTVSAGGTTSRWGICQHFGLTKVDPGLVLAHLLSGPQAAFDDNGKANWANEQGVKGIERAVALITAGSSPKDGVTWNNDDMYDQFAAGRCAMVTGTSVRVPNLQKATGQDNIVFIPYPSDVAGSPSRQAMNAWMTGVWSGSRNQKLAGKFVAFMASSKADGLWSTVGGTVPIRASSLASLREHLAQPKFAFLGSAMKYLQAAGWAPALSADVSGYRDDLNRAVQQVILNGLAPQDALKQAEEAYNNRHKYR